MKVQTLNFLFFKLVFSLLILPFIFGEVASQDFQTLTPKFLINEALLVDINNYEDENLIITKKEIFKGLNQSVNLLMNSPQMQPLLHIILIIYLLHVLIMHY